MKLFCTFLLLMLSSLAASQASWQSVAIGTDGTPRGYWEFLPSDYAVNANQDFPIVIFFHGLGEGGNGDSDLDKVLQNGPPEMVDDDIQNNVFASNQVIMLAPQVTNNTWWNENHMRPFFDYALSHYRINPKRIYFTGLSAGSGGIHEFMDDDAGAAQVTAFLTTAVRGFVERDDGAYLAAITPYWGLTARGDVSNTLKKTVNHMAGFLTDTPATDVMDTYTNDGTTRTANFHPDLGWTWYSGVNNATAVNPKITLYPGGAHNSWDATYNNADVWTWLFAQVKPDLTIQQPTDGGQFSSGQITFIATASDADNQGLDDISWSSSIDGFLGSGEQLQALLSAGVHDIEVVATDDGFRGTVKTITIEVDTAGVDLIFKHGFEP